VERWSHGHKMNASDGAAADRQDLTTEYCAKWLRVSGGWDADWHRKTPVVAQLGHLAGARAWVRGAHVWGDCLLLKLQLCRARLCAE